MGGHQLCAVTPDDTAVCGARVVVATDVLDVFEGWDDTVILHRDGSVETWPTGEIHTGPFTYAGTGWAPLGPFGCGLLLDRTMECWGPTSAPEGEFESMSVGMSRVCAVRMDREVVCWSADDSRSTATPPKGFPGP